MAKVPFGKKLKERISEGVKMTCKTLAFILVTFAFAFPLQRAPRTVQKDDHQADFKNMLGVNAFEWNFLQNPDNPADGRHIFNPKMSLIENFGGVRHYLDWKKIEPVKGTFTFNPTKDGGWNLDTMYESCKRKGIDVLVCLKTCPDWLLNTYPVDLRDNENVPVVYKADKLKPSSYTEQAKAGFQFAARYGYNKKVDQSLIHIDTKSRWTGDPANVAKIGTGLISFIECDNERDKTWKGDKAFQNPEEYAANLSAFYDGDQGRLGKGVGIKQADPNMKVVMAGLASPDINYLKSMVNWCKQHRGYRKDGTIDLCFDVINYHFYANDHEKNSNNQRTTGVSPESSEAGRVADSFTKLGKSLHLPVWVTEAGYDIRAASPQRAISLKGKTAQIVQADWIARSALLYSRWGIKKVFFYELYDDHSENDTPYASSGLVNNNLTGRPSCNYISQMKTLMGNFHFIRTISSEPEVDQYAAKNKILYVLWEPTQANKIADYKLSITTSTASIYRLSPYNLKFVPEKISTTDHSLKISVSETPTVVVTTGEK